jgi:hypothetical protein
MIAHWMAFVSQITPVLDVTDVMAGIRRWQALVNDIRAPNWVELKVARAISDEGLTEKRYWAYRSTVSF